jgi:hypothetical protein
MHYGEERGIEAMQVAWNFTVRIDVRIASENGERPDVVLLLWRRCHEISEEFTQITNAVTGCIEVLGQARHEKPAFILDICGRVEYLFNVYAPASRTKAWGHLVELGLLALTKSRVNDVRG